MTKARVGVLLAGAYGLGLVILLAVGLAIPCETVRDMKSVLSRIPRAGHRAALLARVAARAGSLGLKHLPAVLQPQGISPHEHSQRFCLRERAAGCGRPLTIVPNVVPVVHILVGTDG